MIIIMIMFVIMFMIMFMIMIMIMIMLVIMIMIISIQYYGANVNYILWLWCHLWYKSVIILAEGLQMQNIERHALWEWYFILSVMEHAASIVDNEDTPREILWFQNARVVAEVF